MIQILAKARDEFSFAEYFGIVSNQWGKFTFDPATLEFMKYVFLGLAALVFFVVAISKIRVYWENRKIYDLPFLLRKLPSRIEHMKEVVLKKEEFTCRFLSDEESRWYDGKFHLMDKDNNMAIGIASMPGIPEDYVNNMVEIKYSFGNSKIGIITTTAFKYLTSKKNSEGIFIHAFLVNLPESIKLEQKRKNVRFEALVHYPLRVYLLSDKISVPLASNCLDFSIGGLRVELESPEAGCLEYLFKKSKIVFENDLDEDQAKQLKVYEILSQSYPEPEDAQFEEEDYEQQKSRFLEKCTHLIQLANDFLSSLSKDQQLELFFLLPALPSHGEGEEGFFPLEKRSIKCKSVISFVKKGDEDTKDQIAMNFFEVDHVVQDILYQYGLDTWRLKQQGGDVPKEEEKPEADKGAGSN